METDKLVTRSAKGMAWSYASTLTNALFNIVFVAVLARLLAPAAFGLFAMAQIVLRFGQYFAQMGLGSALVQKKELSEHDIRTAWTLVLIFCSCVFVLIWFAAPIAALYFKTEEVIPIIRVAAIALVLQAGAAIPLSLLRRDMNFRSYSIVEILSYVLGYGVVGVLCAWNNMDVWSLVMAQIGQSSLQLVFAWTIVKCPFIPGWDKTSAKHLLSFGGRVSLISFLEFISASLDTILAGRFLGKTLLGYYNRGKTLPHLPLYYTSVSLNRVLFPLFSKLNIDEVRQREVFRKSFSLLCLLLIPAAAALSLLAPIIVRILLGPNWILSIPIVRICAFAALFDLLGSPLAIFCEAKALLNIKIGLQFIRMGTMFVFFLQFRQFEAEGIAYAYLISQFVTFAGYAIVTKKCVGIKILMQGLIPGSAIALVATTLALLIPFYVAETQLVVWSLQASIFALCVVACYLSPPFRNARLEIIALTRKIMQR